MSEFHDESETGKKRGRDLRWWRDLIYVLKVTAGVRSRDSGRTSVEAITS